MKKSKNKKKSTSPSNSFQKDEMEINEIKDECDGHLYYINKDKNKEEKIKVIHLNKEKKELTVGRSINSDV